MEKWARAMPPGSCDCTWFPAWSIARAAWARTLLAKAAHRMATDSIAWTPRSKLGWSRGLRPIDSSQRSTKLTMTRRARWCERVRCARGRRSRNTRVRAARTMRRASFARSHDRGAITMKCVLALLCGVFCARAAVSELKDGAGKVIIKYAVENPDGMAAAGTKDPAKQVGLILCFPEHDR